MVYFQFSYAFEMLDNSNMKPLADKVEARLAELDRNPFEAARIGGLERSFINDIRIGRKKSVSYEKLPAVAAALDWSLAELMDIETSERATADIPVFGYAGAREQVNLIDGDDQGPIDEVQPLRAEDGYRAVVVKGHSMLPAYRDGDVLFFREDHMPLDSLIGRDCIVLTADMGRAYVKRMMKGSDKGLYTLLSYAPGIDPLPDVKVLKAWAIEWIRRK